MTPSPQPPAQLTVVDCSKKHQKKHTQIHAVPDAKFCMQVHTHTPTQINRQPPDPSYVNAVSFCKSASGIPLIYSQCTINRPFICLFIRPSATHWSISIHLFNNCICSSLHPSILSSTVTIWHYLCLSALPRAIPLISGKNWITRRAEKRRRAVISYNIECGVVVGVLQEGSQCLSQKCSHSKKTFTEGKEKS